MSDSIVDTSNLGSAAPAVAAVASDSTVAASISGQEPATGPALCACGAPIRRPINPRPGPKVTLCRKCRRRRANEKSRARVARWRERQTVAEATNLILDNQNG